MSPERIPSAENELSIEARLLELGWEKGQVGNFSAAIEAMAEVMAKGNEGDAAGKVNVELAARSEDGEDVAEATLTGEGAALEPRKISELIEKGELPIELLTEASTEFFADQNKVILRRKKHRVPETDSIQ